MRLFLFVLLFSIHVGSAADPAAYAPLKLYAGTWHVAAKNQPAKKVEILKNDCAQLGNFYACQQTVDGVPQSLIIFIPGNQAGHYYTQSVRQDGRATGRADLEITGGRWVYLNTWDEGGKTTYYRTINLFTGKNHIHFDQQESPDGKDWKTTNSGEEDRAGS